MVKYLIRTGKREVFGLVGGALGRCRYSAVSLITRFDFMAPVTRVITALQCNCLMDKFPGKPWKHSFFSQISLVKCFTLLLLAKPWILHWMILSQKNYPSAFSTGPSCSKLTTSLVNISLNFQKFISQICHHFLLKKCEKLLHCKSISHFFNKKFSVFGYKL